MLEFNHRGDVLSATYKPSPTSTYRYLDLDRTTAALEKMQLVEGSSLISNDHPGTPSTFEPAVISSTPLSKPSQTSSSNSSEVTTPALSDCATFSSDLTEGILTPEEEFSPQHAGVAHSGLKKNEHALHSCEIRLYSASDDKNLQDGVKASPSKEEVKEQRRALLAAKTEASLREAFRQLEVRRERQNKQRGTNN